VYNSKHFSTFATLERRGIAFPRWSVGTRISWTLQTSWQFIQTVLTDKRMLPKMVIYKDLRRVSEWLAATLEMWCPANGVAGSSPVPSAHLSRPIGDFLFFVPLSSHPV
jgi:hypothetical protein